MNKRWIELKLNIEGKIAHKIGEFLIKEGAHGVFTHEKKEKGFWDEIIDEKEEISVYAYFLKKSDVEEIIERIKDTFGKALQGYETHWLGDEAFSENWKCYFQIIERGNFAIVPSWMEYSGKREPIKILCGLAFGTGTHPTTRMCMELVEKYVRRGAKKVLDVGCGSGILSILAVKAGAESCLGVDVDKRCVEISELNAMLNEIKERVKFVQGSVDSVNEEYELVVVNIYYTIIKEMMENLVKRTKKDGILVLSGILESVMRDFIKSLPSSLKLLESWKEEGWVSFVLKRII